MSKALNPFQTDSSAEDFVLAATDIPDAAVIIYQIEDPNNSGEGLFRKITGANLKAAVNRDFVGKRRQIFTNLSVTPVSGIASILTLDITPAAADALIRIQGTILSAPNNANPNNKRTSNHLRVKKGSGSYTGIDGTGTQTYLGGGFDQNNYQDWNLSETSFEFLMSAADTDVLRFNLYASMYSGSNRTDGAIWINRGVNDDYATKGCTWIEVTQHKPNGGTPLTIETVTAADAA